MVSAINRRTKDFIGANHVKEELLTLSNLKFIEFDIARAIKASEIAIKTGLRGMDAIVVSIAREFESELITFDKEMEEKAKVVLN
ncbi:MAG: PIN domain-containing protein [Ignavibacteriaceae bacterium]